VSATAQGFEDLGGGRYALRGALRFQTVPALWRETQGRLGAAPTLTVDLEGVAEVDSAGLALMVEWLREARKAGRTLRFENVPEQLLAIARVSRLEGLLG
jgi:phospholipid transport system transporter-binding protein